MGPGNEAGDGNEAGERSLEMRVGEWSLGMRLGGVEPGNEAGEWA